MTAPLGHRECPRCPAWLGPALILVLAGVWRCLGITTTEVWRDEAITILHTRAGWADLLLNLARIEDSPPLGFLLFKLWSLISTAEVGFRLFSVLCGVLAVAVCMRTAQRIRPGAGWSTGLLASLSQVPVHYSQEIRVYSLLFLLTALCFWTAERMLAAPTERRWPILLAVLAAACAHLHAVGLFVLPMVGVYLLACGGRGIVRRSLLLPTAVWLALIAPMIWFALHWSHIHRHREEWWIPAPDLAWWTYYAQQFFGLAPVVHWVNQAAIARQWVGFIVERLTIAALATILLLAILDRRTRGVALALALAAATFLAALAITSWLSLPNVLDRTLLPAWCPIVLLLGVAIRAALDRHRAIGCAALGIVLVVWSAGWAWTVYGGGPRRSPNEAAFAWIHDRLGSNDLVVSSPIWFEDLSVYRLGDRLPGEHFLSVGNPVYAGSPPRHLPEPRLPDPSWRERMRERLDAHRRVHGLDYNVWIVSFGGPVAEGEPDSPADIIARDHQLTDTFIPTDRRATSVVLYRPIPRAE